MVHPMGWLVLHCLLHLHCFLWFQCYDYSVLQFCNRISQLLDYNLHGKVRKNSVFSSVLSLSKDIIDGEPIEQDIAIEKESQWSKLSRCLTLALLSLFIISQVVIDTRNCMLEAKQSVDGDLFAVCIICERIWEKGPLGANYANWVISMAGIHNLRRIEWCYSRSNRTICC